MTNERAAAAALSGGGRYRLVAFDFDGTLADTFPWFASVLNDVADRYRFRRVSADEAEALRGLDARAVIRQLGIPHWQFPLITRHMQRLARRNIHGLRLFPQAGAMLAELDRAGVVLALVSSNAEDIVRGVLGPEAARIRHYACGASLFGKARRLRRVMRAAGLPGAAVLAVGDEIRDGEAAREAGCAFAAVGWGYTRASALAAWGAEPVFGAPGEILRYLLPEP